MKVIIEDAINGAKVRFIDDESEQEYLYEYTEEKPEKFVDMVWDIKEFLGPNEYDKFAEITNKLIFRNIVVHGHKHDCKKKWCESCKRMKALDELEEE